MLLSESMGIVVFRLTLQCCPGEHVTWRTLGGVTLVGILERWQERTAVIRLPNDEVVYVEC